MLKTQGYSNFHPQVESCRCKLFQKLIAIFYPRETENNKTEITKLSRPILFMNLLCRKLMDQGIYSSTTHFLNQEVRCKICGNLIQMHLKHEFDWFLVDDIQFWPQTAFHMRHIRAMKYRME